MKDTIKRKIIFKEVSVMKFILFIIITVIIAAVTIYKLHNWHFSSIKEEKRTIKDFTSNVSERIYRQVKVYGMNGKLIQEYEGTFDNYIETNHYLLFDEKSGLRHIIYFAAGIVVVDELKQ